MIRDWGRSLGTSFFETVGRAVGQAQERRPLPVDLLESADAYLAVFDAPGATASDVQVRFVEGRIEVRIDRFRAFNEGFEMVFPGRGLALDGRVELPEGTRVDPSGADAVLKDVGELHVRVPKVAETDETETDGNEADGDEADAGEADAGTGDGDEADEESDET